ncbi:hypothetical protein FHR99_003208 [Litorivivens lipolytica]|uniref:BRCT domain-containing protein n=1 Tax=Litorivivens lipolytica TaxID=1524264 RepID=A0A7W4Z6W0_9GAMM|nr:BRCT domain-containing protein [Litorivivens lipolytica]MBB3048934.1 hypothetical protein [Litorivivens lipolytica]
MIEWAQHLNKDGQPLSRGFNHRANKEKLALCLRGILEGIEIEGLKDREIVFLQAWLDSVDALQKDGDLLDLADFVRDILQDGEIEPEERKELAQMVADILEYSDIFADSIDAFTNQLIGFCKGIAADDYISDKEVHELRKMLHTAVGDDFQWPASELAARLDIILADGVITDDERAELLTVVKGVTGARFTDTGLAEGFAVTAFCDPMPELPIDGLTVCFTGKCLTASRQKLHEDAQSRGAIVKRSVSSKLQVLVTGELASRDWVYTSHGRKIEQAIQLKRDGHSLALVSEQSWVDWLSR